MDYRRPITVLNRTDFPVEVFRQATSPIHIRYDIFDGFSVLIKSKWSGCLRKVASKSQSRVMGSLLLASKKSEI